MQIPRLDGKTILITGGSSGIGLESAVDLAAAGAQVVITARDRTRGEKALQEIRRRSGSDKVELLLCDFESQKQIRRLAAEVLAKYSRLHVLVNNAGTVYANRELTEDGIEKTFAVNHLGPFLLTNLLLDRLLESAPARIVNVSSVGHKRGTMDFTDLGFEHGYSIMKAYSRSKLGNVLFTNELARRLAGRQVTATSLHPGAVATNIWAHAPWYARPFLAVARRIMFITPKEGSQTITWLAASPEAEGMTGEYFYQCRKARMGDLAQDKAVAARLWEVSARLTGLESVPAAARAG